MRLTNNEFSLLTSCVPPTTTNRHFYRYEPPRPLEVIETDIKRLEDDIVKMLKEVTA